MSGKRNRYANMNNPVFQAVISGMFSFKSEQQAVDQINQIKTSYIISKEQPENSKQASVILWIKGFNISPEEDDKGFMGNFALISYRKTEEGRFTITATKLESDGQYHPQRKREKLSHPNWGHPILRSVKKKRVYPTIEEAQAELQLLHEEFPTATIPNPGKLYIMIYSKAEKGKSPIKKFVLELKAAEKGGFYITSKDNTFTGPAGPSAGPKKSEAGKPETSASMPKGYFTSMVQAKRARKRKPAAAPKSETPPTDDKKE